MTRAPDVAMKPIRFFLNGFTRSPEAKTERRMKISNLTRQSELACCVRLADDSATRRKGLLGLRGLGWGEGLWISPCEAVHTFGMKFSIDLVFLDRELRVKKVRSNVSPWRVSGCLNAHSVLELASGTVCKTGTKAGDKLDVSPATEV